MTEVVGWMLDDGEMCWSCGGIASTIVRYENGEYSTLCNRCVPKDAVDKVAAEILRALTRGNVE